MPAGSILVADDGFVYFVSGQTNGGQAIFSAPVAGGETSRIFEVVGQPIGNLALDAGALYFAVLQTLDKPGSIHRMQDRVDQVIADAQPANSGLAIDSTFAYFSFTSLNGNDHGIKRVDKTGQGTASTLLATNLVPITVRVDSQHVYYRDQNGVIFAAAKDGSESHVVSGNSGRAFLIDFDVNAFVVYWLWTDPTPGPHGLFRSNADGTGFAGLDTASDNNWADPRVDDTAAYYWHDSSLMKRLK